MVKVCSLYLTSALMGIPIEILTAYRELSERMDGDASYFPLGTTPDNFGGRHLDISF